MEHKTLVKTQLSNSIQQLSQNCNTQPLLMDWVAAKAQPSVGQCQFLLKQSSIPTPTKPSRRRCTSAAQGQAAQERRYRRSRNGTFDLRALSTAVAWFRLSRLGLQLNACLLELKRAARKAWLEIGLQRPFLQLFLG